MLLGIRGSGLLAIPNQACELAWCLILLGMLIIRSPLLFALSPWLFFIAGRITGHILIIIITTTILPANNQYAYCDCGLIILYYYGILWNTMDTCERLLTLMLLLPSWPLLEPEADFSQHWLVVVIRMNCNIWWTVIVGSRAFCKAVFVELLWGVFWSKVWPVISWVMKPYKWYLRLVELVS